MHVQGQNFKGFLITKVMGITKISCNEKPTVYNIKYKLEGNYYPSNASELFLYICYIVEIIL